MSPSERFPLAARSNVPLLRYQGGTVGEDYSLCPGSTVLGGEVQSTYAGSAMPLGEVCPHLRETMEQYVSFSDDTVLDSVALLERFFEDWNIPGESPPAFTNVATEEVTVD